MRTLILVAAAAAGVYIVAKNRQAAAAGSVSGVTVPGGVSIASGNESNPIAGGTETLSNVDFVEKVYRDFLHREADTDGLNYWVGRLQSGLSRPQYIAAVRASAEYKALQQRTGNTVVTPNGVVISSRPTPTVRERVDVIGTNVVTRTPSISFAAGSGKGIVVSAPQPVPMGSRTPASYTDLSTDAIPVRVPAAPLNSRLRLEEL